MLIKTLQRQQPISSLTTQDNDAQQIIIFCTHYIQFCYKEKLDTIFENLLLYSTHFFLMSNVFSKFL
jgi:hypothetical protein